MVEQILSGPDVGAQDYLQVHDEWVLILSGAAVLEIDGEPVSLGSGDWAFLPAGVPHRLVETEAGTNWLAVNLHPV